MLISIDHKETTLYDALASARTACRNSKSEAPVILLYEMTRHTLNIMVTKNEFGLVSESITVARLPAPDSFGLGSENVLDPPNNNKPWGVDTGAV